MPSSARKNKIKAHTRYSYYAEEKINAVIDTVAGDARAVAYTVLTNAAVNLFFKDTATTEIYTLSLHDALPTSPPPTWPRWMRPPPCSTRARCCARWWDGTPPSGPARRRRTRPSPAVTRPP